MFSHICFNSTFQNVLSVSVFCCSKCFHVASCKCVYLNVAYVFTHMMQVFYLGVAYVYNGFKCFSCVFIVVSDACFKCFIYFQTYVAIVASGCFKLDRVLHLPSRLSSVSPWC
jgi:hypothetical protein